MHTTDALAIDPAAADLLFREAHTAYRFTAEPVDDAQLAAIYDLTRLAPTALNAQPLRITYLRSAAAKERLMPHLAPTNRAKSASAPVVAILAADTDFHEHLPRLLPQMPDAKDGFADPAARAQAAVLNASMQAAYFILAVRAAGLSAGPMGGIHKSGIDAEFFAGTALRSFLVVNIGHADPAGVFPRNPRLSADEAVRVL